MTEEDLREINAHRESYGKGYDDGFADGHDDGYDDGYDDGFAAGQEAMRERAAAEVCREAEDSCECDGPLNSGAVMGHGPLCPACSLNRLAEAIRALGVEP